LYLFFDTETNGLWRRDLEATDPNQPHLVQIAAQLVDEDEKVVNQYSMLIRPEGWSIPKDAEDIHGISNEKATTYGVPLVSALSVFNSMAASAHTLVAHNLAFDLQIIARDFLYLKKPFRQPKDLHCTMMSTKDILKLESDFDDYKFPKLIETYEHFFNVGYFDWHDALADVQVCRIIYFHLKNQGIELKAPRQLPKKLLKVMNNDDYEELIGLISKINRDNISEWESNFLKDQEERIEKYKEKVMISDKQMNIIRRMTEK
jgi:DNA polymerase III subunit epsilon